MHKSFLFLAMITLAAVSLACGMQIHIPVTNITTSKPITKEISINKPDPSAEITDLTLNFGLGNLYLTPGAKTALVKGTAVFNIKDLKPKISSEGNHVEISTGDLEINGIPKFDKAQKNDWNLQLGDMPMALNISAGAYNGDLELGGLSIQSLKIMDGASDVKLKFSEPNKVEMDKFIYETGASTAKLFGLANANFNEMEFKSGAGDYTLEFSGELLRSADVTINTGMSSITIVVPKGTAAHVIFDGGFSDVDMRGGWQKEGNEYFFSSGEPLLTININMAAGSLTLKN